MLFCGSGFAGGELACALTPTGLENINYVELKNGIYDDLYISKATDFELTAKCPEEWDFDTILWAKFNHTTNAGNVDWNLETTSHIILKSRPEGRFKWKTIAVKETKSIEDFVLNYPDYLVASGQTMEYALVPILYGMEGDYATTFATPKYTKMFLIEDQIVWGTEITDGFCDTTRNLPSSTVELLNSRYPLFIRNTIANYDTGSCKGSFVPLDETSCEFTYEESQDDRQISWNWVEIGNVNSESDLYYLGFSKIEAEWWDE